jgi:hypothetical protein
MLNSTLLACSWRKIKIILSELNHTQQQQIYFYKNKNIKWSRWLKKHKILWSNQMTQNKSFGPPNESD